MGLFGWLGWGVFIPNEQDPRDQTGRPDVGRSGVPGKRMKDLRSSSRGEGWCGGQNHPGDISEERIAFMSWVIIQVTTQFWLPLVEPKTRDLKSRHQLGWPLPRALEGIPSLLLPVSCGCN